MISKAKIKYIHSLEAKKARTNERAFVAEGHKLVGELIAAGHKPDYLCATQDWKNTNPHIHVNDTVTSEELRQASLLKNPQQVIATFPLPDWQLPTPQSLSTSLTLMLDGVQDPGNLGTICRLADWFGIENIICSPETADIFNPKAIQATMGAIARIHIHYTQLTDFLKEVQAASIPVYGTFLNGHNIYQRPITQNGIIIMGNEGKGISAAVEPYVTDRLYIPNYPAGRATTESLNVAVATAITCAEFRRRT